MPSRYFGGPAEDDPSLVTYLPPTWPHDEAECVGCWLYGEWTATWEVGPKARKRVVTDRPDYVKRYPRIYRELSAHARQVRLARRAHDRDTPTGPTEVEPAE